MILDSDSAEIERCEGCDQPGTTDWCGTWLCADCLKIEMEEADPVRAAENLLEEKLRRAGEWPPSQRGDTLRSQVHWIGETMDAIKRLSV